MIIQIILTAVLTVCLAKTYDMVFRWMILRKNTIIDAPMSWSHQQFVASAQPNGNTIPIATPAIEIAMMSYVEKEETFNTNKRHMLIAEDALKIENIVKEININLETKNVFYYGNKLYMPTGEPITEDQLRKLLVLR